MKLIIAEKPSVGRSYKELLEKVEGEKFQSKDGFFEGKEYCISWCVGHLVGLSDPSAYGWGRWSMQSLPMLPANWKYDVFPGTKKQFDILSGLIQKSSLIINGTDAGREGELIYRLVVMKSEANNKPQKRLWINSFVMKDMEKAWKNLHDSDEYKDLFFAAIIRAKSDWIVGMNASRLYSLTTGVKGLSCGRVQTPTLALVVKRDHEVENWKDKHYFILTCKAFNHQFTYVKGGETKFPDEEALNEIKAECEGKEGEIQSVNKQNKNANPPKPFDLAALQKEANSRYGLKAADTLKIAQQLYEKKFITYPRTDSAYLPENMYDEAFDLLSKIAPENVKEHLKPKGEKLSFFNSKKVTDHYAIIPTGHKNGFQQLSEKEKQLYNLVLARFIMAFGKTKKWIQYDISMKCEGHHFTARVNQVTDPGFTAIKKGEKEEEEEQETTEKVNLKQGDKDICREFKTEKKKVTKPKYYTEATLISAMETAGKTVDDEELKEAMKERGLGTPATKASIIEILKKRDYITTKGKSLISTNRGRQLIDLVDDKVKSPEMTGEWEYKLKQMEKGKYNWKDFSAEIESYIKNLCLNYSREKVRAFKTQINSSGIKCPKCSEGFVKKAEKAWYCSRGKEACGFVLWRNVAGKKLTDKMLDQLLTKGKTTLLKGFKSKKSGKVFEARLEVRDHKVTFAAAKETKAKTSADKEANE